MSEERNVEKQITIKADADAVWKALTDAEELITGKRGAGRTNSQNAKDLLNRAFVNRG
jgi:hypothetical protein